MKVLLHFNDFYLFNISCSFFPYQLCSIASAIKKKKITKRNISTESHYSEFVASINPIKCKQHGAT